MDAVNFLNFVFDTSSESDKGMKWVQLMLSESPCKLTDILEDILSNEAVLKMYSPFKSYFWKNPDKLIECAKLTSEGSSNSSFEDGLVVSYRKYLRDKYGHAEPTTQEPSQFLSLETTTF